MGQFTVIGLGRFGSSASLELMRLGHSVVGIDIEEKFVNKVADNLTLAVVADATDENALRELNVLSSDAVLVAIGENLEASILCVLLLKNVGVKEIWVKATSKPHHTILSKLNVSRIIHPEEEMGVRVAQSLNYPMVNQYMAIGSNLYIVEIEIPEKCRGLSVKKLLGDAFDHVTLLLVRRRKEIYHSIDGNFILETLDALVLAGSLSVLKSFAPRLLD